MVFVLLIDKSGSISETKLKTFSMEEVCKKAKVKNINDYSRKNIWSVTINDVCYHIALYAKIIGRAGQENKYDFPPPVDSELYYGNCMLVNQLDIQDPNNISDLKVSEWNAIYEKLFGGFDDCNDDEEMSEDDAGLELDKTGYEMDGFVVNDDDYEYEDEEEEEDEEEDTHEDEEEEEEEVLKPPKKKRYTKKKETIVLENEYLGCDSELEEEKYF